MQRLVDYRRRLTLTIHRSHHQLPMLLLICLAISETVDWITKQKKRSKVSAGSGRTITLESLRLDSNKRTTVSIASPFGVPRITLFLCIIRVQQQEFEKRT
ncbi:hypothetical protein Bhyg_06732 [Pseudolycoriella hygida]|uniref:Uncharacterized protein n=1 Tax=Pseudolycoriella hygida TaxID=35572 RepID=A0A9Q0S262_9DIPT|nr:hypothetical protein Bhyg_06732 [Pseudolycoriella hygida]